MAANEYLIRLRAELTSNAAAFGAEMRREFQSLQSAASPRAATAGLARVGGQSLAGIEAQRSSGTLTSASYDAAIKSFVAELEKARAALSETFGSDVKAPSEAALRRSFAPAFRAATGVTDDRSVNVAATSGLNQVNKVNADAAATTARQQQASAAEQKKASDAQVAAAKKASDATAAAGKQAQDQADKVAARAEAAQREGQAAVYANGRSVLEGGGLNLPPSPNAERDAVGSASAQVALYRQRLAATPLDSPLTQLPGQSNALDREFGLRVGLGDTGERLNQEQNNSEGTKPSELRANLSAQQHYLDTLEAAAVEQERINGLVGARDQDLAAVTAKLAETLRQRQLIEERITLAATEGLTEQEGQNNVAKALRKSAVQQSTAAATTPENTRDIAAGQTATADQKAALQAEVLRQRTATGNSAVLDAETNQAKKAYARSVNEAEKGLVSGGSGNGSLVQRAQQFISNRSGAAPRSADEFQTGPQLLSAGLLTTAKFAASGALLYGASAGIKDIISQGEQLDQTLAIVKTQFDAVTASGKNTSSIDFSGFKDQIIDISKETGVAANDVATVTRQLAAAFSDKNGNPDFDRAAKEAQVALQFSKISGLPEKEITDSLTAISIAFNDIPFDKVIDRAINLENRFGVLAPDIISFTADLAPLAAQLGFTVDQLESLGAVAQLTSGLSGSALSSQFSRILPTIQQKSSDVDTLFSENPATAKQLPAVASAFAKNDIPEVLSLLVSNYDKLDKSQQNYLATLIGSRREAGAFYALLDRGSLTIEGLSKNQPSADGDFAARWASYTKTVSYALSQMRTAASAFGIAIFNSGLGAGLSEVTKGVTETADAALYLLKAVAALNGALGGLPGYIALGLVAMKALTSLWGVGARALGDLTGGLSGVGGLGGGLARLQSPYSTLGPVQSLKPSVAAAEQTPVLRGLLTRQDPAEEASLPTGGLVTGSAGAVEGGEIIAGTGTAVASAIAALAPLIAVAATVALIARIQDVDKQIGKGLDDIDKRVADQLKAGVSAQTIQANVNAASGSSTGRATIFQKALSDIGIKSTFGIATDPGKQVRDRVAADIRASSSESGPIEAQLDSLTGSQRGFIDVNEDTGNEVGESTDSNGVDTKSQQKKNRDAVNKIIAAYKGDKGNKKLKAQVEQIIADGKDDDVVSAQLDAAKAAYYKNANVKTETDLAAANLAGGVYDNDLDTAQAAYAAGLTGVGPVIQALKSKTAAIELQIRDDQKDGNTTDLATQLASLATVRQQGSDAIGTAIDDAKSFADALSAYGGNTDVTLLSKVAHAKSALQSLLNTPGTQPAQKLAGAEAVLDAQQALFEQQVTDAVGSAAKLNALQKGPAPADAATQRGLQVGALTTGANANRVDDISSALSSGSGASNVTASAVRNALLSNLKNFESGNHDIVLAMLDARKKQLQETIKMEDEAGQAGESGSDRAALTQVEAAITSLGKITASKLAQYQADTAQMAQILEDAYSSINGGNLSILRAQANGDPQKLAGIDALQAKQDFTQGVQEQDPGKVLSAVGESINAGDEAQQASAQIVQGQIALLQAQASGDAVEQAELGEQGAAAAVSAAQGQAAKLQAMAQEVTAHKAVQQALDDVYNGNLELIGAVLTAAGDTVGAAENNLQLMIAKLNQGKALGAKGADLSALQAQVVTAQAQVTTAQREDRLSDLDYLYEFNKITIGQYIKSLQDELATIPETNKAARQEIEEKIKSLEDDVQGTLQFNIPDLKLPTEYEARRLQGANNSLSGYQDNRQINMPITINNGTDLDGAIDKIIGAAGASPRNSPYPSVGPIGG